MNTKQNADNVINLNETVEDAVNDENAEDYKTIETAFNRMKKIQKQMTMQKIFEMQKSLAKLEKELNKIIINYSGNS